MPIPPDNGADSQLTRRRGQVPVPGRDAGQRRVPGESGNHDSPPPGTPGGWYGSAADGAAGKGPVRGYPPVPGQPPPMYPPGQFAAWNRGQSGREAPRHGQSDSGRHQAAQSWQAAGPQPERPPAGGSGYYGRRGGAETDPGYSMLAVSDPAADVTSTQTWQAIGDGRATGVWTMPDRPGAGPAGTGPAPGGPGRRESAPMDLVRRDSAAPAQADGSRPGRSGPDQRESQEPASAARPAAGPGAGQAAGGQASGGRRAARGHSAPRTAPEQVQRQQKRKRKRPASVRAAITAAVVLVLAAVAALSYAVLRSSPAKPRQTAAPAVSKPAAAPSPSPTLGPYGDIGSRKSDPVPLSASQLFPASYSSGSGTVVLTASKQGTRCAAGISGSALQSAVSAAGCDQVVRATYLSSGQGLMGTIGVFNLATAARATKAVKAADASDFVSQLTAPRGKTAKIGQGTGIEEAAAKGHYLILIWAEFTSLRKPKTAGQRVTIENFMTQMLDKTANVSLANRMVSGSP